MCCFSTLWSIGRTSRASLHCASVFFSSSGAFRFGRFVREGGGVLGHVVVVEFVVFGGFGFFL